MTSDALCNKHASMIHSQIYPLEMEVSTHAVSTPTVTSRLQHPRLRSPRPPDPAAPLFPDRPSSHDIALGANAYGSTEQIPGDHRAERDHRICQGSPVKQSGSWVSLRPVWVGPPAVGVTPSCRPCHCQPRFAGKKESPLKYSLTAVSLAWGSPDEGRDTVSRVRVVAFIPVLTSRRTTRMPLDV